MKKYRIGILGATGAVGREILKVLSERNFPVEKLKLFASEKSKGKRIVFNKKSYEVGSVEKDSFCGLDFVFGAVKNNIAKLYADDIVKSGATFIDNSSEYRLFGNVPLVIPEINPGDAFLNGGKGIISNPNCSTIIILTAINSINKISKILKIIVSTYQAASGMGQSGLDRLGYEARLYNSDNVAPPNDEKNVFPEQLIFNVIPSIGRPLAGGYTSEEAKLTYEARKILHNDDLKVSATCVRVPVFRSHSMSVNIVTENHIDVNEAKLAIKNAGGCVLSDDISSGIFPTPLKSSDKDAVYVGRIREDPTDKNGIALWCSGDQLRKGAALNAVQIAELLIKNSK